MTTKRKQYSQQFKFKVALEAAKELQTINEIASTHGVHPSQVKAWKKQLLTEGNVVFGGDKSKSPQQQGAEEAQLYEQIGRLKVELEWVKKKAAQFS